MSKSASDTARAFTTYSLVPYLGILFCPGAFVMGGLAVMQSTRVAAIDSKVFKAEQVRQLYWLALSSLILILQLLLWWILYKVPQWAQG